MYSTLMHHQHGDVFLCVQVELFDQCFFFQRLLLFVVLRTFSHFSSLLGPTVAVKLPAYFAITNSFPDFILCCRTKIVASNFKTFLFLQQECLPLFFCYHMTYGIGVCLKTGMRCVVLSIFSHIRYRCNSCEFKAICHRASVLPVTLVDGYDCASCENADLS